LSLPESMPFLGKDWRSNGDEWIKTEQGWERIKVLECILDNLNNGLNKDLDKKKSLSRLSTGEENEEDEICSESFNMSTSFDSDLGLVSDEESDYTLSEESDEDVIVPMDQDKMIVKKIKKQRFSLRKLSISTCSIDKKGREKPIQPHIPYNLVEVDIYNREIGKLPRASVSEVLNALDMPGAVKDIKRFNYVCRLVQVIINEKFNQLSGNAQRTLFLIVKEMLIQVIKSQENTNTMRKLLVDFKKAIQDSTNFYYFYHIGSQKLGEKHLMTINKWQKKLDNDNQKRLPKRLTTTTSTNTTIRRFNSHTHPDTDKENENIIESASTIENIPFDCKLAIMRRLNTGLDLVNLAKCSSGLNKLISQELTMWKDLCQFHFQQTAINFFVSNPFNLRSRDATGGATKLMDENAQKKELDWKAIYFKLKGRYGNREVYADMIQQCFHCKCLFWKEIGHPCVKLDSLGPDGYLKERVEPITPKKLVNLLQL